jgi:hypothetical protein
MIQKNYSSKNNPVSLIKAVNAAEIYPMFVCPCCGKPLDPNNICCGSAKERIDYIDSLVAKNNLTEKEIILAYVKKFGLNSFVDPNKQEEIKEELTQSAPANRPILTLSPASIDFGDVSQKKGVTFTYFDLKNEGNSDLIINKLDTSCGCTSATIVFQDVEGPKFTMPGHGSANPENWQISIPPQGEAKLKVYYDPAVHQDFRGYAIRKISIFSNDPIDFEKSVQVELNQVD